MKIVEKVHHKRLSKVVMICNSAYIPGKGTIDAVFILRRIQEEYFDKQKKLYMCFADMEKVSYRVPRKVV